MDFEVTNMDLQISCPFCLKMFSGLENEGEAICPSCGKEVPLPPSLHAPEWVIVRSQQRFGPFSWLFLRELVRKKRLFPAEMVCRADSPQPVLAYSIPGLFSGSNFEEECTTTIDDLSAGIPVGGKRGPLTVEGILVRPNLSLTLGDFQVLRKLGAGGMGAVYLAYQRSRNRAVALKMLARPLAVQKNYVDRFYREANVLGSFDHPNIVQFYGSGEEKNIPYIAMEYIDGWTGEHLVRHFGRSLPLGDALHIALQCARALDYAHRKKVVHRDIKPGNIMITRQGQVKLGDLGLAKPLDEDLTITESGACLGTPQYMAPEQSRNAKHVDLRSDIYALGGVLYHFLTGRPPFRGESSMELFLAKEQGFFPSARRFNQDIPGRLELFLDKMLAKNPKHRYQNCGELIRDLESLGLANPYLSFNPIHALPLSSSPGLPPGTEDLVEILLVHNSMKDIALAQEALEQTHIPCNLTVVDNSFEALEFLNQEGKYSGAHPVNLIILGIDVQTEGMLTLLEKIKNTSSLAAIPVLVLAQPRNCLEFLRSHQISVSKTVNKPEDLNQFEHFFRSAQGLCLTVVNSG